MLGSGSCVLPDVLGLAVLVQARRAELAADARLLVAAPLGLWDIGMVVVDPHRAVLKAAGDTLGPAGVLRPDRAGQTVVGVVGDADSVVLAGKAFDRQH